jgi:hypothetical protein
MTGLYSIRPGSLPFGREPLLSAERAFARRNVEIFDAADALRIARGAFSRMRAARRKPENFGRFECLRDGAHLATA